MQDEVLVLALVDRLIYAFASIEAAERELEPIDVLNGEYFAIDGEGNTLELSVEDKKTSWGKPQMTRIHRPSNSKCNIEYWEPLMRGILPKYRISAETVAAASPKELLELAFEVGEKF